MVKQKKDSILVKDFDRIHRKGFKPRWSNNKGTWVMSKTKLKRISMTKKQFAYRLDRVLSGKKVRRL